jgi:ribulose-phosphate 3-epimerase
MKIRILPSLLAADAGNLEAGARMAETAGGDALHIDVMDGHFVPNISMGPAVVRMAKRAVGIPLSVHLMLSRPDQFLAPFIEAGADQLLIHIEASCDVPEALARIRKLGAAPGITLNPETPADLVFPVLNMVDEVLCMTVHPGYGGQEFMPEVLPKIGRLATRTGDMTRRVSILVDGGITDATAAECAAAGADAFVAGSSLYSCADMASAVARMRAAAVAAYDTSPA